MIVMLDYKKDGCRFEDVMRERGGKLITDRERAIEEARYFFEHEPSTKEVHLVYIDSDEDNINLFYEMEEKDGGYDWFYRIC